MTTLLARKRTSALALAIALATGSAVVTTAVMPAEAMAQRNRDRDNESEEVDGGGFGRDFVEAFQPLNEAMGQEGADIAALRPQMLALGGQATTRDEQNAAGGLIYNAGARLRDQTMQLTGMELLLGAGLIPAESAGRYNFIAYQLANGQGQPGKARQYLQSAIDNNFTTETITLAALQITMVENLWTAGQFDEGYNYLFSTIEARKAQGLAIDEQWYRRGVAVAYNNELTPTIYGVLEGWVSDYPNTVTWKESINITRNLNNFQPAELLDILRLGREAGALEDAADYEYYIEAADARRLPKEVRDVIEAGLAANHIGLDNLFIAEAREVANGRVQSDRADLPALENDANAPGAGLRTVTAAGGTFLSYGDYAKAAGFYQRALEMPGVDRNEALTRIGIAQVGLGDYAAALTSFGQVQGTRSPIARLWSVYARMQQAAAPAPAPTPSPTAPATM